MKVVFLLLLLLPVILASYHIGPEISPGSKPFVKPIKCESYCPGNNCGCPSLSLRPTYPKRRNLLVGRYGFRIGKRDDVEEIDMNPVGYDDDNNEK